MSISTRDSRIKARVGVAGEGRGIKEAGEVIEEELFQKK